MISKGQTIENPVTGEHMTFSRRPRDPRGVHLIELRADPGGTVAAAHVHPSQTETFEVVSGTLGAKVAGQRSRPRPAPPSSFFPASRTNGGTPATTSSSSAARFARRSSSSR